jgi:hypothetical protein
LRDATNAGVPPQELEEVLWQAVLAAPEELGDPAPERRLLVEVRKALAAWKANRALWEQRDTEFRRAMEAGGILVKEKPMTKKKGFR